MRIKQIAAIIIIFISFSLFITFSRRMTGKVSLPISEMSNPDYIPGVITINISEDTWIGCNALPGSCQAEPCENGEMYCEKNCTFSHKSCYDSIGPGGYYGYYLYVSHPSSTGSGCGRQYDDKRTYLWFNMSEGRTANGNYTEIPWYLIKNATIKLWVNSSSCGSNNVILRPVLPNENKNTTNTIIHNLVWNDHYYYLSGEYYTENSTFFGSEIQRMCPTVNTMSEWNITDYVINQTRYSNDVFVQLSSLDGFAWSVNFSSKENTNESQRPYLQIELNSTVCGDGYCTPLNETIGNCLKDCAPTNYIEVNGEIFTQPQTINITCWSGNLSSETYLWNNYNRTFQLMLPTGNGTQTNITLSSNLNAGIYTVYCNSTWNSTLTSKNFAVVTATNTPTTVPPSGGGGGGGGGGSIKTTTTTTTIKTTTTTTAITTTTTKIVLTTTTTTIPAKVPLKILGKKMPIWIIGIATLILVVIVVIIFVIRRREKTTVVDLKLDDYGYDYE